MPIDRTNPSAVVKLRGVAKRYSNGTLAVTGVDLDLRAGEFVSLLGPSGCGKSTLLRLIAGLGEPSAGHIDWPTSARDVGFVFQDATLMPWSTALDNVILPLRLKRLPAREAAERAEEALTAVGLDGFRHAYPRELSGGMKMRVSIARALVTGPKVLLMDEPFAALDEITRHKLNDDLLALWAKERFTVVFVTHSVFEFGLSVAAHCRHGGTSGPHHCRSQDGRTLPARCLVPDLARLCRRLPLRLGQAPGGDRGMTDMAARAKLQGPAAAAGTDAEARPVFVEERRWLGITGSGWQKIVAPVVIGFLALGLWEFVVRHAGIPPYILPGPWLILRTLVADWGTLSGSLWITLEITGLALLAAVLVGGLLSILFTQSKWLELSLFPYAIILQVTPIVAIAPLIIIWVDNTLLSLLICAWIVAFFPILSNTILGLNSADHNLVNLFELYGASRWQTLRYLRLPAALPYFLGGLRISGGLALIGAVVAEFVAGSGGTASGLAFRILEAGYQLKIPRMFAALVLVSASGIVIFLVLSLLSHLLLRRWHESAVQREN